jgi:hypothetical protein
MAILKKIGSGLPFEWVNLESYRDSKSFRKEIYLLNDDGDVAASLIMLFYELFGKIKKDLLVYDNSWGDFCLDTWNVHTSQYNYEPEGKSSVSKAYLVMLQESKIEPSYSGSCSCENWDAYLPVILDCILSHQAPYSPIFYNNKNQFFFYFHHSGGIGLYYKENSPFMTELLANARHTYDVRP